MNMTKLPEYGSYSGMKNRCYNKNHKNYHQYGGRGIKVCDEWLERKGFLSFLEHVGKRPSSKHSIDRINTNGNYEPGNVRWATQKEQCNNRRVRVDNKVGISGVNFNKALNRWVIRKSINGERKYVAQFKTSEEAKRFMISRGM